jgi:hypothetical protein
MLLGLLAREPCVTLFDGSILSTAAVCAPEIMMKLLAPLIDCFAELASEKSDILFETFRAWLEPAQVAGGESCSAERDPIMRLCNSVVRTNVASQLRVGLQF